MIKIIDYIPEHFIGLQRKHQFKYVSADPVSYANEIYTPGYAYSALLNDEVIACAGVSQLHAGVGRAWALLSPEMFKYPLSLHRATMKCFPKIIELGKFHRVEAVVRRGFGRGCNWVQHLGFEIEGVMKKFDPDGNDYYLYSKII